MVWASERELYVLHCRVRYPCAHDASDCKCKCKCIFIGPLKRYDGWTRQRVAQAPQPPATRSSPPPESSTQRGRRVPAQALLPSAPRGSAPGRPCRPPRGSQQRCLGSQWGVVWAQGPRGHQLTRGPTCSHMHSHRRTPCSRCTSDCDRAMTREPTGWWGSPRVRRCSCSSGRLRRMSLNSRESWGASKPVHAMPLFPPLALRWVGGTNMCAQTARCWLHQRSD